MGHRNGYFSAEEEEAIQEDIREKKPDFVFVGIPLLKKSTWSRSLWTMESTLSLWEVGGKLWCPFRTYQAGTYVDAKANLEWLFRVANEPKRLFKRYFVGKCHFIKRVVHENGKQK